MEREEYCNGLGSHQLNSMGRLDSCGAHHIADTCQIIGPPTRNDPEEKQIEEDVFGNSTGRCKQLPASHVELRAPYFRAAASSTSFAIVFMFRAVPAFPAGIFSLECAMPSP